MDDSPSKWRRTDEPQPDSNLMSQLAVASTTSGCFAGVTPNDFNNELEEPPLKSLDGNDLAVSIILEPMPAVLEGMSANNPFVSPVYWWNKAYKM